MIVVETKLVALLGVSAITIFPFVFVRPGHKTPRLMKHEGSHWRDQCNWFLYGLGVGLIVWFLLYLFALPYVWNPLRRHTETKAFLATGLTEAEADARLRKWPYLLRW